MVALWAISSNIWLHTLPNFAAYILLRNDLICTKIPFFKHIHNYEHYNKHNMYVR